VRSQASSPTGGESTRDLYRELKQIRERWTSSTSGSHVQATVKAATRGGWKPAVTMAAGLVAGAVLATGTLMLRPPSFRKDPTDLSAYRFTPIAAEDVRETAPAWSPDGKSLVYLAAIDGVEQVFARTVESPHAVQITRGQTSAGNPRWAPDGSAIYFTSGGSLWAVGSAGGTPDRVVENAGGGYAVHPDGQTILFIQGGLWLAKRGEPPRPFAVPPRSALRAGDDWSVSRPTVRPWRLSSPVSISGCCRTHPGAPGDSTYATCRTRAGCRTAAGWF
jgi:WD40-like Beta Propeller Repeat